MTNAGLHPFVLFAVIPAIGHINPLLQQALEMRRRGWRVALATTEELRSHVERTAPDIPFIALGSIPADLMKRMEDIAAYSSKEPNLMKGALKSSKILVDDLWPILFDGLVARIRSDRPDVMVVDNATVAGFDAAESERVPFVVNNPDLLTLLPYTLLQNVYDIPLPFSGVSIHAMTPLRQLLHRAIGPFVRLGGDIVFRDLNRRFNACRHSRGLPPVDFRYRLKDTMVMTNCAFGLEYRRPLPPLVQMVGPMLREDVEPLPDDYRDWLDHGLPVVYANLGTIALPPKDQMHRMLTAFSSDRYRVLWILKKEQHSMFRPEDIPSTVRIESWGPPPRAILSHRAVRVFVSHCGINSAHESLQVGTPIVGIPMLADQQDMAMRVQDAGAGLMLNKARFTSEQLSAAILRVMNEESFRAAILPIQASFREAGGIHRAADLIERCAERSSEAITKALRD